MPPLKIAQYPKNQDGTPMDLEVLVLTDAAGLNGARLEFTPVGPDGAPIDAKAAVVVDPTGALVVNASAISNVPYGPVWDGSGMAPSQNTVYDKINALEATISGGGINYKGTWNASTNTPAIPAAAVGNKGWYYKVSVAGTTSINGINDWGVDDWIVSNGVTWDKVDNSDKVSSVNGQTGVVTITKADVGLSNVDNTSDANKPISNATQTALNLKLDDSQASAFGLQWLGQTDAATAKASLGLTKADVGLDQVDNTADIDKPVSNATQLALNQKAGLAVFTPSTNGLAPASGGGSVKFLCADGTWKDPLLLLPQAGVSSFNGRTGAVVLTGADVNTALGYTAASTALVSTSAAGLAPTRPGGTDTFLRGDGAWAVPAVPAGSVAWGAITGTLSNQTDLQNALNAKAAAVHTHVPADILTVPTATVFYRKTAGTGAAETQTLATLKTDLGLTGTNSGDQTSIAGITGTLAQFNTALTDDNFAGIGAANTFTADQTINKASPQFTLNPTSGGSVVELMGAAGTQALRLQGTTGIGYVRADTVYITNKTGAANYGVFSATGLAVTGTLSATGAVSGSNLSGTNTGDQSSIVGITGTIAQFNTACSDADFSTVGHVHATFTSSVAGFVPASGGGTANFLRADGTFAAPPGGGGLTDGDKGDVVVSGGGTVLTVESVGGAAIATVSALSNYLPLTGGTVTGLLACSSGFDCTNGNIVSQAAAGGNAQYDLKDDLNVRQGLVFWNRGDDTIKIRRYDAAGTAIEGELTIGATIATFTNTTLWLNTDKMYMLHNGTNGYIRTAPTGGGDLYLGAQGASTLQLIAGGAAAFSGSLTVATTLAVTGAITQGGVAVLTAGLATSSGLTMAATNRFLGRDTAGSGAVEEITATAAMTMLGAAPDAPRIGTSTSNATLTPVGTNDMTTRTTQTVALTIAAPTGTAVDGFGHVIRIKATAAIATVTWNAIYRAIGVTLPTSLVNAKTTYIGIIYNALDTKWDVVSVATEA